MLGANTIRNTCRSIILFSHMLTNYKCFGLLTCNIYHRHYIVAHEQCRLTKFEMSPRNFPFLLHRIMSQPDDDFMRQWWA